MLTPTLNSNDNVKGQDFIVCCYMCLLQGVFGVGGCGFFFIKVVVGVRRYVSILIRFAGHSGAPRPNEVEVKELDFRNIDTG